MVVTRNVHKSLNCSLIKELGFYLRGQRKKIKMCFQFQIIFTLRKLLYDATCQATTELSY